MSVKYQWLIKSYTFKWCLIWYPFLSTTQGCNPQWSPCQTWIVKPAAPAPTMRPGTLKQRPHWTMSLTGSPWALTSPAGTTSPGPSWPSLSAECCSAWARPSPCSTLPRWGTCPTCWVLCSFLWGSCSWSRGWCGCPWWKTRAQGSDQGQWQGASGARTALKSHGLFKLKLCCSVLYCRVGQLC